MNIASEIINEVKVLELSGSFDIYSATPVRYWLEQTLEQPPARIVVDLSNVNFIDSTALAILMQGIKKAREANGDIYICGLQQPVRMVLELTRLDNVFEIYPNKEQAIIGFNR
jgi:anti-sigma B factor antagonist